MKKVLIFLTGVMLFLQQGYSQDVEVIASPSTSYPGTRCIAIGEKVTQIIYVYNRGSLDVSNIPFILEVYGQNGLLETLHDTLKEVLRRGTYKSMYFAERYTVPDEKFYSVIVKAELENDVTPTDNTDTITECVARNNDEDIAVVNLLTPGGMYDEMCDDIYPEVRIRNWSSDTVFRDVPIYAVIYANGERYTLQETIDIVYADSIMKYTFSSFYTVPEALNFL